MADETKFTQADLDAAVEKAVGPLKSKLDEVMDEAKEAKRKLRAASEIKPEDLTAAEERADRAEAALKEAQKLAKDATTAKEKAEGALEAEQGITHKLIVDNGLSEALAANGVTNPVHQKAARALLSSQVQLTADGESRVAKVGDKALADFVKEWAAGDEGKHFVSAANNSGGGSQGSKTQATGKTMTRDQYNALSPLERATAGMQAAKGELTITESAQA